MNFIGKTKKERFVRYVVFLGADRCLHLLPKKKAEERAAMYRSSGISNVTVKRVFVSNADLDREYIFND